MLLLHKLRWPEVAVVILKYYEQSEIKACCQAGNDTRKSWRWRFVQDVNLFDPNETLLALRGKFTV